MLGKFAGDVGYCGVFMFCPTKNYSVSVPPSIPTLGVIQELSEATLASSISQWKTNFLKTTISRGNIIVRLGFQHSGSKRNIGNEA